MDLPEKYSWLKKEGAPAMLVEAMPIVKSCNICQKNYSTKATQKNRLGKCDNCRNKLNRDKYAAKRRAIGKPVFQFYTMLAKGIKKCNKCLSVKSTELFSKRSGTKYRSTCKACDSTLFAEYNNKNKAKINYNRRLNRKDPEIGIIYSQRDRQRSIYNSKGIYKTQACTKQVREWLGCSPAECKVHIESLFKLGMTWGNKGVGVGKWQIDHKMPVSLTQLDENNQIIDNEHNRQIWHYSNLQPLWHFENARKSNFYEPSNS